MYNEGVAIATNVYRTSLKHYPPLDTFYSISIVFQSLLSVSPCDSVSHQRELLGFNFPEEQRLESHFHHSEAGQYFYTTARAGQYIA